MRILVDLSFHGFGHVAQAVPVLRELQSRNPGAEFTLRSGAPEEFLREKLAFPLNYLRENRDFGFAMKNALEVDVEASRRRYLDFHRDWDAKVAREAEKMSRLAPDFLLADVPYLSLAAAAKAGIPAYAFSSLNWADLYLHFCAAFPESHGIHAQMLAAYNSAAAFFRAEPAMPMPEITVQKSVGPLATVGVRRRNEIAAKVGCDEGEVLVLLTMGGLFYPVEVENWPDFPGIRWLVQADLAGKRPSFFAYEALGMPFADVVASCDLLVTKPGYGSFVEAACLGLPVLYLERREWPESACLVAWLKARANCFAVSERDFARGRFADEIAALLAAPARPPVEPCGAADICDQIARSSGAAWVLDNTVAVC